jgi:hypothetical protein
MKMNLSSWTRRRRRHGGGSTPAKQHQVYIKSSVVAICDLTSLDLHSPSSITCRVVFCLQQSSGSGQRVVSFGSIFSCPLPKWQILNPLGVMAHWYGPFCNPRSSKKKKVLGSSNWCRGNSLVFFFFFFKRTSGSVVSYYYYYYF